ncbi:hypothetical protein WMY93_029413 [Mugilogobius chulae]|uniref:Serine/threonine-protein kinase 1 n=1 Tax=Mugilogobius chulae TaxID=88201 RepID=A0AAW0N233_9GOBI
MRYKTWPEYLPKKRRIHAWRSCPSFNRLDRNKNWTPKFLKTRSMRTLELETDSDPVPGPSGLSGSHHRVLSSDGRVLSGKRRQPEDCWDSEQPSPSKRSRCKSPVDVKSKVTKKTNFFATYRVIKLLWRGGFGTIVAGERISDNFPVAIKSIPKSMVFYTERMDRCATCPWRCTCSPGWGWSRLFRMRHHTLLLDWYDLGDEIVLVMERPDPCMDILDYATAHEDEPANIDEIKDIFRQLVDRAIAMEAKGVFHRDIKPENILLDNRYTPPRAKQVPYTAKPVTVWQLGLVLFAMLFNKRPLVNEQTIASKRAVPIPTAIPEDCRDLLKSCLQKNPNNRITLQAMKNHPWLNPS